MLEESAPPSQGPAVLGSYGFRVLGVPGAAHGLLPVPPDWPALRFVRETRTGDGPHAAPGTIDFTAAHADVALLDGDRLHLDRETLTVRLATREPISDEAVLHP